MSNTTIYESEDLTIGADACEISAVDSCLALAAYVNETMSMSREGHADRYLRMTLDYLDGRLDSPSDQEVEEFLDVLAAEWPGAVASGAFDYWRPRIKLCAKNPGYFNFMKEWGHTSSVGVAWVTDVCLSSPRTLEVACGYYRTFEDPDGWYPIESLDPYMRWAMMSATFQEARVRAARAYDLISDAYQQSRAEVGQVSNVLIVGSGRLPELRFTGYTFDPSVQRVFAIDKDPRNDPEPMLRDETFEILNLKNDSGQTLSVQDYLEDGGHPSEFGLYHFAMDVKDFLQASASTLTTTDGAEVEIPQHFDVIVMNGVSMYLGRDLPMVLHGLLARLTPGGEMFWDYSFPTHWDLARSVMCFGWGLGSPELLGNRQALTKLWGISQAAPSSPGEMLTLVSRVLENVQGIDFTMDAEHFAEPANAVYFTMSRQED